MRVSLKRNIRVGLSGYHVTPPSRWFSVCGTEGIAGESPMESVAVLGDATCALGVCVDSFRFPSFPSFFPYLVLIDGVQRSSECM